MMVEYKPMSGSGGPWEPSFLGIGPYIYSWEGRTVVSGGERRSRMMDGEGSRRRRRPHRAAAERAAKEQAAEKAAAERTPAEKAEKAVSERAAAERAGVVQAVAAANPLLKAPRSLRRTNGGLFVTFRTCP